MLREYDYYAEAFRQNEEFGEKRVTSFLTLLTGVGAALGFLWSNGHLEDHEYTAVGVTALVSLGFGELTLARLIKRNLVSDGYKEALALVRAWFCRCDTTFSDYLYHPPKTAPKDRRVGFRNLLSGGWVETMFAVNSLLAASAAFAFAAPHLGAKCTASQCLRPQLVALAAALGLLVLNFAYAKYRYEGERDTYLRRTKEPLLSLDDRSRGGK